MNDVLLVREYANDLFEYTLSIEENGRFHIYVQPVWPERRGYTIAGDKLAQFDAEVLSEQLMCVIAENSYNPTALRKVIDKYWPARKWRSKQRTFMRGMAKLAALDNT